MTITTISSTTLADFVPGNVVDLTTNPDYIKIIIDMVETRNRLEFELLQLKDFLRSRQFEEQFTKYRKEFYWMTEEEQKRTFRCEYGI